MKVTKATVSSSKIASEIDLFSDKPQISKAAKREAAQAVGEFLVEQINAHLSQAKSPVSGESFPGLSRSYKKFKQEQGLGGSANLEFSGAMKDAITFRVTDKGVEVGVFGSEAPKADGHNNFSGESKLPQRRFLPDESQNFKTTIAKEVDRIVSEYVAESVELNDSILEGIETKSELFNYLESEFEGLSRSQIVDAILVTTALRSKLDRFDLLRFLGG